MSVPIPTGKCLGCSVTSPRFGSHSSCEKVSLPTKRRATRAMAVNEDLVGVCSVSELKLSTVYLRRSCVATKQPNGPDFFKNVSDVRF